MLSSIVEFYYAAIYIFFTQFFRGQYKLQYLALISENKKRWTANKYYYITTTIKLFP